MDALFALLDCALGISPVTSYSGVRSLTACTIHGSAPLQHVAEEVSEMERLLTHGV